MRLLHRFAITSLVAFTCTQAHARPARPEDPCAVLARPMRQQHIPGVAIAVFRFGQPTLSYCGVADQTTATPVTAQTVFQAASLGLPVFAYAVLQLVRDGKLNLDKPLASYLDAPYEHQQHPFARDATAKVDKATDARFKKITARMVLAHTSGLPNWSTGALQVSGDPGRKWSYSGEGYVYLQRVVEQITGQPLEEFVQENVFLPLQMSHSTFVPPEQGTSNLAMGYDRMGRPVHSAPSQPLAPCTLYTTLGDYARFLESLVVVPVQDSPFGMEEQPQAVADAATHVTWGLGIGLEDAHDKRSIFHVGSNPGFQSFFLLTPDTGDGVLFFTNSDNGLALVPTALAQWSPGRHPVLRFPLLKPHE